MTIELFPRLYTPMAESYWKEISECRLEELERRAGTNHPMAAPGATGGVPVDASRLSQIRQGIRLIAIDKGYPDHREIGIFDSECSRYLCESAAIPEPEALRDEVWNFLTLVLMPDIAVWRFPGRARERMLSGVRNTFQRLWLRGRLIAQGGECHESDWELIGELTEDAFVALIERPRLSANPCLAREFAEAWRRCARATTGNMEAIHRVAARNLMATKAVISLESLDLSSLVRLVDDHFAQAAREAAGF